MKVLHLFNEINFSGGELMYANAASFFQSKGVEMLAVSTGKEFGNFVSEFEKNNIKTYHWPIKRGIKFLFHAFSYYQKFYRFLKTEKIDVVHIHRSDLFFVAVFSYLAKVKTIKTMHNVFKNRKLTYPYGYLQRFIARQFLHVTFQTIGKSVFDNELYYYKNPSVRVNNWYDSNRFFPAKNKNEKEIIREKLSIEKNAFVIISVGGCSHIKNHSDILHALNTIDSTINILYLHLGTGADEAKEQQLARELHLENKTRFIGNVNNVQDYLITADVYVMSSKFEGLSIACIEAMACEKPLILYNSPGLRDLIDNDDNGFLIEWNYKVLAQKIVEYYKNPHLIIEKGRASRNYVLKNHNMEKNVLKIIALYKYAR